MERRGVPLAGLLSDPAGAWDGTEQGYRNYSVPVRELARCLLLLLADSPSLGLSPSQLNPLEDLELLLTEGLASPEPLGVDTSERYECSGPASSCVVPEHDTPKQRKQLEQW